MLLHTLPSGMRVLLDPIHTAPVLSFSMLVQVGSADESDSQAGISHVIEHMLFKGTPSRPVGTIARDVEAAGGEINAYTSFDQTVYYINMAKQFGDKGLEILADAVQHPLFDAEELARESEVILEEIRRERDNPGRFISEILFKESFQKHPYGRPIIGFDKTVRSFTRQHLVDYYKKWYVPNNRVFIVVGDFDPTTMLQKIERAFSEPPHANPPPKRERLAEPIQKGLRVVVAPDNIQTSYLAWGYHIPSVLDEDVPALDLLSHILAGSDSSRLEQQVKEKLGLVQNIYSYAYTPRDPALMVLGAQLSEKKLLKATQAICHEIERIRTELVTIEELKNAKLNIRSAQVYEKETVGGLSGKYAYFLATAGRADFEKEYFHRLMDLQAEDVRRAAQKYLSVENLTATVMIPKTAKKQITEKAWKTVLTKASGSPTKIAAVKQKEIQQWTLPNGIRLIVRENHALPLVAVTATGLGGLMFENKSNNGINGLISRTWTKGTKNKDQLTLAKTIEGMAAQIDPFSGRNSIGLKGEFLSDFFEEGLDLFTEILLEPSFDPKEVAKEKSCTIEAIRNQEDNLPSLAFFHFQKLLFPTHPFGMRGLGEIETIQKMTSPQLKSYYQKLITGKNLVVSVVGNVSAQEVHQKLKEGLKKIPARSVATPAPKLDPKPSRSQQTVLKKDKMQSHIVLGFQGTTITSPDYYPMTVLSNILSGQGGRLFLELRDKMSLAYAVSCVLHVGLDPGIFAIYIGTEPSKVPTALQGIKRELKLVTEQLVRPDELERTQQYLVGTYELELQKNSQLSSSYAFNELYGMGIEEVANYPKKIMAITRQDVLKVAQKYIHLDAATVSIIEP